MKLKFTSRNYIYIALLAILIIVFYYGVQFIGTSREGLSFPGMSGVIPTNEKCGFGKSTNCIFYCGNITDSNGKKFNTGTCHNGTCWCGTSSEVTSSRRTSTQGTTRR
jgi:hypothetical protein